METFDPKDLYIGDKPNFPETKIGTPVKPQAIGQSNNPLPSGGFEANANDLFISAAPADPESISSLKGFGRAAPTGLAGLGGAVAGAELGALGGSLFGPVGSAIGGFGGGVIGAFGASAGTGAAVNWALPKSQSEKVGEIVNPKAYGGGSFAGSMIGFKPDVGRVVGMLEGNSQAYIDALKGAGNMYGFASGTRLTEQLAKSKEEGGARGLGNLLEASFFPKEDRLAGLHDAAMGAFVKSNALGHAFESVGSKAVRGPVEWALRPRTPSAVQEGLVSEATRAQLPAPAQVVPSASARAAQSSLVAEAAAASPVVQPASAPIPIGPDGIPVATPGQIAAQRPAQPVAPAQPAAPQAAPAAPAPAAVQAPVGKPTVEPGTRAAVSIAADGRGVVEHVPAHIPTHENLDSPSLVLAHGAMEPAQAVNSLIALNAEAHRRSGGRKPSDPAFKEKVMGVTSEVLNNVAKTDQALAVSTAEGISRMLEKQIFDATNNPQTVYNEAQLHDMLYRKQVMDSIANSIRTGSAPEAYTVGGAQKFAADQIKAKKEAEARQREATQVAAQNAEATESSEPASPRKTKNYEVTVGVNENNGQRTVGIEHDVVVQTVNGPKIERGVFTGTLGEKGSTEEGDIKKAKMQHADVLEGMNKKDEESLSRIEKRIQDETDPAKKAQLELVLASKKQGIEVRKRVIDDLRGNAQADPITVAQKNVSLDGVDISEVPVKFKTRQWQADKNSPQGGSAVDREGEAPVVEFSGRLIVLRNVNGVQVPFYLSTGGGGKKDVPEGKWYPFFGVADGWLNKIGGKDMATYHGRADLATVARHLDKTLGDIRDRAGKGLFPAIGDKQSFEYINKGLSPVENGTPETRAKLEANIKGLFDRLDAASASKKQPAVGQAAKPAGDADLAPEPQAAKPEPKQKQPEPAKKPLTKKEQERERKVSENKKKISDFNESRIKEFSDDNPDAPKDVVEAYRITVMHEGDKPATAEQKAAYEKLDKYILTKSENAQKVVSHPGVERYEMTAYNEDGTVANGTRIHLKEGYTLDVGEGSGYEYRGIGDFDGNFIGNVVKANNDSDAKGYLDAIVKKSELPEIRARRNYEDSLENLNRRKNAIASLREKINEIKDSNKPKDIENVGKLKHSLKRGEEGLADLEKEAADMKAAYESEFGKYEKKVQEPEPDGYDPAEEYPDPDEDPEEVTAREDAFRENDAKNEKDAAERKAQMSDQDIYDKERKDDKGRFGNGDPEYVDKLRGELKQKEEQLEKANRASKVKPAQIKKLTKAIEDAKEQISYLSDPNHKPFSYKWFEKMSGIGYKLDRSHGNVSITAQTSFVDPTGEFTIMPTIKASEGISGYRVDKYGYDSSSGEKSEAKFFDTAEEALAYIKSKTEGAETPGSVEPEGETSEGKKSKETPYKIMGEGWVSESRYLDYLIETMDWSEKFSGNSKAYRKLRNELAKKLGVNIEERAKQLESENQSTKPKQLGAGQGELLDTSEAFNLTGENVAGRQERPKDTTGEMLAGVEEPAYVSQARTQLAKLEKSGKNPEQQKTLRETIAAYEETLKVKPDQPTKPAAVEGEYPIDRFEAALGEKGLRVLRRDNTDDFVAEGGVEENGRQRPTIVIGDTKITLSSEGMEIVNGKAMVMDGQEKDSAGNIIYTLERVVTDPKARGKGSASKALAEVTAAADAAGLTLQVEPTPFRSIIGKGESLSKDQLIQWYKKNGFEQKEAGSDMLLIRKPNATSEAAKPKGGDTPVDPEAQRRAEYRERVENDEVAKGILEYDYFTKSGGDRMIRPTAEIAEGMNVGIKNVSRLMQQLVREKLLTAMGGVKVQTANGSYTTTYYPADGVTRNELRTRLQEIAATKPVAATEPTEVKGKKGLAMAINRQKTLISEAPNDGTRKLREKDLQRMQDIIDATKTKYTDNTRIETVRRKIKEMIDENVFKGLSGGLDFIDSPKVRDLMDRLKGYESKVGTVEQQAEAVLKPLHEGEPADITKARKDLSSIIRNMSRGEGWDAKRAEAESKLEQYEAEHKMLSGEHLPTREQLDIVSNKALEEFVERFGEGEVRPEVYKAVTDEFMRRLDLRERAESEFGEKGKEVKGDMIGDIADIIRGSNNSIGIPTLPKEFGAEELNALRENLGPALAKKLMRNPTRMGKLDTARAASDKNYRDDVKGAAEGMLSDLAQALHDRGWTQFDPSKVSSDVLKEAILRAAKGESLTPEGGVLGRAAKDAASREGMVDRLYKHDESSAEDPFSKRDADQDGEKIRSWSHKDGSQIISDGKRFFAYSAKGERMGNVKGNGFDTMADAMDALSRNLLYERPSPTFDMGRRQRQIDRELSDLVDRMSEYKDSGDSFNAEMTRRKIEKLRDEAKELLRVGIPMKDAYSADLSAAKKSIRNQGDWIEDAKVNRNSDAPLVDAVEQAEARRLGSLFKTKNMEDFVGDRKVVPQTADEGFTDFIKNFRNAKIDQGTALMMLDEMSNDMFGGLDRQTKRIRLKELNEKAKTAYEKSNPDKKGLFAELPDRRLKEYLPISEYAEAKRLENDLSQPAPREKMQSDFTAKAARDFAEKIKKAKEWVQKANPQYNDFTGYMADNVPMREYYQHAVYSKKFRTGDPVAVVGVHGTSTSEGFIKNKRYEPRGKSLEQGEAEGAYFAASDATVLSGEYQGYDNAGKSPNVAKSVITFDNPLVVNGQFTDVMKRTEKILGEAIAAGHDGVIYINQTDGGNLDVSFIIPANETNARQRMIGSTLDKSMAGDSYEPLPRGEGKTSGTEVLSRRDLSPEAAKRELERRQAENAKNRQGDPETRKGYQGIVDRVISEARLRGEINEKEVEGLTRILNMIGSEFFEGVKFKFGKGEREGEYGQYATASRIVSIFKDAIRSGRFEETSAHEIAHHLTRFLPESDRAAIRAELATKRAEFLKRNKGMERILSTDMKDWAKRRFTAKELASANLENPTQHLRRLTSEELKKEGFQPDEAIYRLKLTDETYRLTNGDEYFAESFKDRVMSRLKSDPAYLGRPRNWKERLNGLWETIKINFRRMFGKETADRILSNFAKGRYNPDIEAGYSMEHMGAEYSKRDRELKAKRVVKGPDNDASSGYPAQGGKIGGQESYVLADPRRIKASFGGNDVNPESSSIFQSKKDEEGAFQQEFPTGENGALSRSMKLSSRKSITDAEFRQLMESDSTFNPREWERVERTEREVILPAEEAQRKAGAKPSDSFAERSKTVVEYKRKEPLQVEQEDKQVSNEIEAQKNLPEPTKDHSGKPGEQTMGSLRDVSVEQSEDPDVFREPRPGQSVARTGWDVVSGRYFSGVSTKAHQNAERHDYSDTVKKIANIIHSRPGTKSSSFEQDMPTAISTNRTKFHNKLNDILTPIRDTLAGFKNTDAGSAREQREKVYEALVDMITGRKQITQGDLGKAASRLKGLLAELHEYRSSAGESIGEVTDYYPAVYDSPRIGESRKEFIRDARTAYEITLAEAGEEGQAKALGMTKAEFADMSQNDGQALKDALAEMAENQAIALYNAHVRGASAEEFDSIFGMADRGAGENPAMSRKFSRSAQDVMRKWQVNDPFRVVGRYITSSSKRAEIVRRFGNEGERWKAMSHQMESDGVPYEIISEMRDLVRKSAGIGSLPLGKASQTYVDTITLMTAASAMGRGFMNNLVEPVTIGMRTGSPIDILRAYGETWSRFLREIPALSKKLKGKMGETFWSEYGHEIGTIHNTLEDAWMTTHSMELDAEYADPRFRWLTNRIYKANLMDASEVAKQQAAHAIGYSYINKLGSMFRGDHWTSKVGLDAKQSVSDQLNELGVKPEDHASFADFTRQLESAKDDAERKALMLGKDPMAELHREAMIRFSMQSSVRSNRAHKPVFQDSELGKTVLQLMNFSYSYAAEVNSRMYNMSKQAFMASPDGKNYSMYDRLRMMGPAAGGLLSILAYRGLLELKDLLYPSESSAQRAKDPELVKWANATSYAGLLGPKFEQVMKSVKRDQAPGGPAGQMLVNVGRAAKSTVESLAEGKDMSAAQRSGAKALIPILKGAAVAGGAAAHPAVGAVVTQATNSPAFRDALMPNKTNKYESKDLTPKPINPNK
jgi:hypothetical protein